MARTRITHDERIPDLLAAVYQRARLDLSSYSRKPRRVTATEREQLAEAAALLLEAGHHYGAHHGR